MGFPSFQCLMLFYTQAVWILFGDVWVPISPCFKVLSSAPFLSPLPQHRDSALRDTYKGAYCPCAFHRVKTPRNYLKMAMRLRSVSKTEGSLSCKCLRGLEWEEVKLLNTVRLCDIKLVSVHTEELSNTKKAEEPHYSSQRHKPLPWPLPVLSSGTSSPMGPRWHPHDEATGAALWVTSLTKQVHCPGSWDVLWDAGEKHPGVVHVLSCAFRGGSKGMEMDRPTWSDERGKTEG